MLKERKTGQFRLVADFQPQGDQPRAIEQLVEGLEGGRRHQVLLGVTGSGKTFTMANVISRINRPTLVIAPNKTLAAQLYNEFRLLLPDNAVRYFISYYDYYQPEAYVPATDTYIAKDASINDEIDKLRHAATMALLERRDVVIVASVSCIYGLGSPEAYFDLMVYLEEGMRIDRDHMLRKLVDIQYERVDYDFHRGTFRVRGGYGGGVPGVRGPVGAAHRVLRRRGGVASGGGPGARQGAPARGQGHGLSGQPLRHHRRTHEGGGDRDPGRAPGTAGRAQAGEQAAGGATPAPADPLRPGAAGGDGVLPGPRELLPPPRLPAGARESRRPRC